MRFGWFRQRFNFFVRVHPVLQDTTEVLDLVVGQLYELFGCNPVDRVFTRRLNLGWDVVHSISCAE
jgi:hypothetical protein